MVELEVELLTISLTLGNSTDGETKQSRNILSVTKTFHGWKCTLRKSLVLKSSIKN